jgi:hypothetical protein
VTPAAAAEILGVPEGASSDEIESAYRRLARASHPDRFAGESPSQLAAAASQFVRVTDARDALLRAGSRAAVPPPYAEYESRSVPRHTRWVFGLWAVVLVAGLAVSSFDFMAPGSFLDIGLRLVPIGVCSIAFALTGKLGWVIAMAVLAAVSVGITFAIASFGPLVAIGFLLVPMLGMSALGRSRRRTNRGRPAAGR